MKRWFALTITVAISLAAAATPLAGCRPGANLNASSPTTTLATPTVNSVPATPPVPGSSAFTAQTTSSTAASPTASVSTPATTQVSTLPGPASLTTSPPPPTTPAPAPAPTASAASSAPASSLLVKMTDRAGDGFDNNGNPVTMQSFLDITETEVRTAANNYIFHLELNGPVPTRLDDTGTAVEWDFFIDSDSNPNTGWNYPIVCNDTGPDYVISLALTGSQMDPLVLDVAANKYTRVAYQMNGKVIELSFNFSIIPRLDKFDFIAATRQWLVSGSNKSLIAADKAPDQGHYQAPTGVVVIKEGLPTVKMDGAHATVYCNEGNEDYGQWVSRAFEQGYMAVNALAGISAQQKFIIYTYRTQSDLVKGLQAFSGFSASAADFFKGGGAPRPFNYVMHIPVGFTWHAIIHEYCHTLLDQVGGQSYQHIKWLDEGLADYLACLSLQNTAEKDFETGWSQSKATLVKTAASQGKLFSLSDISDEGQWTARSGSDNTLEYAEAYWFVNFIAPQYGINRCLDILRYMKSGDLQESAVQKALGVPRPQIEADFQKSLNG